MVASKPGGKGSSESEEVVEFDLAFLERGP